MGLRGPKSTLQGQNEGAGRDMLSLEARGEEPYFTSSGFRCPPACLGWLPHHCSLQGQHLQLSFCSSSTSPSPLRASVQNLPLPLSFTDTYDIRWHSLDIPKQYPDLKLLDVITLAKSSPYKVTCTSSRYWDILSLGVMIQSIHSIYSSICDVFSELAKPVQRGYNFKFSKVIVLIIIHFMIQRTSFLLTSCLHFFLCF